MWIAIILPCLAHCRPSHRQFCLFQTVNAKGAPNLANEIHRRTTGLTELFRIFQQLFAACVHDTCIKQLFLKSKYFFAKAPTLNKAPMKMILPFFLARIFVFFSCSNIFSVSVASSEQLIQDTWQQISIRGIECNLALFSNVHCVRASKALRKSKCVPLCVIDGECGFSTWHRRAYGCTNLRSGVRNATRIGTQQSKHN